MTINSSTVFPVPGSQATLHRSSLIVVLSLLLFALSCAVRAYFFSGFILGDDIAEFGVSMHLLAHPISLESQIELRWGSWLYNWFFLQLLGVSEFSFFLPTILMSASFSVMALHILRRLGYSLAYAFFGGIIVASAPFEVLIGTLRANDMPLGWLLGLALTAFIHFRDRPATQGAVIGVLFFLGFYVKLWVVYFLPVLGIYYLIRIAVANEWRGGLAFAGVFAGLQAMMLIIFKLATDDFIPFINNHAATYPVASENLWQTFGLYPQMVFVGSEHGSTLFGHLPHLVLTLMLIKTIVTMLSTARLSSEVGEGTPELSFRLDSVDGWLFAYYASFFVLLNFVPNSFVFDQYYSAPRIFRYMAPLSFPMALHLAKLLIDLAQVAIAKPRMGKPGPVLVAALLLAVVAVNLYESAQATTHGRSHRQAFMSVTADIRKLNTPLLVSENWIAFFFRNVQFRGDPNVQEVVRIDHSINSPRQHEDWLAEHQVDFEEGTLLLTGLGSYVYYGAYWDGFHLNFFNAPLHPNWKLVRDYGQTSYLPFSSPVQLWRLEKRIGPNVKLVSSKQLNPTTFNPSVLLKLGMASFDANDCPAAMVPYERILKDYPESYEAGSAIYFKSVCLLRGGKHVTALAGFKTMIMQHPRDPLVGMARYQVGVALAGSGRKGEAYSSFLDTMEAYPNDKYLTGLCDQMLMVLDREIGLLRRLYQRWFGVTNRFGYMKAPRND